MNRTIDLSAADVAIVRAILAETLPAAVQVWVFGSRVRGTSRRYSDLDLALQADARLGIDMLGALADALSESDLPFKVDLVDLNDIDSGFRARITPDLTALPP